MLFVLHAGCPWRDLRERYGKWSSVSVRCRRWAEPGIWDAMRETPVQLGLIDDWQHMIDSTTIRGHSQAAGAKGESRGEQQDTGSFTYEAARLRMARFWRRCSIPARDGPRRPGFQDRTYVGSDEIVSGMFHHFATECEGYGAEVITYLEDGDHVAVSGVSSGPYRATDKTMTATFAHLRHMEDGKIVSIGSLSTAS